MNTAAHSSNRIRFCLEIVEAVRSVWPERSPLFVRVSATDWMKGGWDIDETIELARRLSGLGVDVIDCSSGGMVPHAAIPTAPGYQVPFAERIKRRGRDRDRCRRVDHHTRASQRDHREESSRPGGAGARDAARPVLAASRGARARTADAVASTVPAGSARRHGRRT